MNLIAYGLLILGMLVALFGSAAGIAQLWQGRKDDLLWLERANLLTFAYLAAASGFLLYAFITYDFSLEYVYSYSDRFLPLFYRITAFWGGQAGSLLFWALMVGLCGVIFQFTSAYQSLSVVTRTWFWVFFLGIMAFFGFLLVCWSNPFIKISPVPADGRGLNPMLQHFGMIIHPPLLFLGYGGFAIPGCLALAQAMKRAGNGGSHAGEPNWIAVARPFTLTAWLFLTAGIVLGAWWAYMELGWGGYWSWDPVENGSLIPWLLGTAAVHTCLLEGRRNKLHRANTFLMALTTVSAFFATYLVRGNVVDSVHAFGSGGVGPALLTFVLGATVVVILVSMQGKAASENSLNGLETREGFLVIAVWFLCALSLIILLGTLWPVISSAWGGHSEGLNAGFYNQVCMPLFTLLVAMLAICPWLGWKGGVRNLQKLGLVAAAFCAGLFVFWQVVGVVKPLPLMGSAVCAAALVSIGLMLAERAVFLNDTALAAYLAHLGVVLLALGIAFSGPGKIEVDCEMAVGQVAQVGMFEVRLLEMYDGEDSHGVYSFLEAELEVSRGGKVIGLVAPQRRAYAKQQNQNFVESATIFSLGSEFYASLLGLDSRNRAIMRMSSHPLVNWLWIGGLLMTLAPFLGIIRPRKSSPAPDLES